MPGVNIRTATRSGPTNTEAGASARFLVAGITERGPSGAPVLVRSLGEFEAAYGVRVGYGAVYDSVRTYFEEGGSEAVVQRVVGATATRGVLVLKDRTAGTPLDTLRVEAIGAGAWSSDVTIAVQAGTAPSTVRIRVALRGTLVEVYDNLTSPANAAQRLAASRFVVATDLGAVSASPTNLPAILAPTALSAGNDQRATVTAATVTAALDLIGPEWGNGAVAVPGYAADLVVGASTVGALVTAHAADLKRVALLATAIGRTPDQASAVADALAGDGADYAGLFYPWVVIPTVGSATATVSPEGYVAGVRARTHREAGPWQPPAGERAVARFVLGPERAVTAAEGNLLDAASVSAIRTIAGTTRLYGWRSLSVDELNFELLSARDTLNTLSGVLSLVLEQHVFASIDARGKRIAMVAADIVGALEPYRAAGGLYERIIDGEQVDPGYLVDVGPTVNSAAVLASNTISAVVSLRISPVGAFIDLTITKVALSSAL